MALVFAFFYFLCTSPALVDLIFWALVFEIHLLQLKETINEKQENMKTKLSILTLGLLLVFFVSQAKEKSTSLISGQSLTEFGQYTISNSTKELTAGGDALKTYELTYSNIDTPVLIGVQKTKKCMNFIVRTGNFEVEYVCKNHVFGVKRISREYQTVKAEVVNAMMDNAQFYTQRIISQNPKTEEELLGLIACYFPSLIKDDYLAKI